jgi:hypothetical protein
MTSLAPQLAPVPISPLSLDGLTRDLWGSYDASAIAQLAPLGLETCYEPKIYKAPSTDEEVFAALSYGPFGLKITPGSIIYGFYLPALLATNAPPLWNLQITDLSMDHKFWDDPIPAFMIGNYKTTYLSSLAYPAGGAIGTFPYLLQAPHPVVGDGLFLVEMWETSGSQQRIECVIGALEPVS